MKKVVDAEFIDKDGVHKPETTLLQDAAKIADKAAVPLEKIPFDKAHEAAAKLKAAAVVMREVSDDVEDVKETVKETAAKVKERFPWMADFTLNFDREILPR